jgi:hypothetical protein
VRRLLVRKKENKDGGMAMKRSWHPVAQQEILPSSFGDGIDKIVIDDGASELWH